MDVLAKIFDPAALAAPAAATVLMIAGLVVWDLRRTIKRKNIDLPHDGEAFNDSSPGECADRLAELGKLGYNVPQHAIDSLREEQETTDD